MWKNKHFTTLYQKKLEHYLSNNNCKNTQEVIQHLHNSIHKAEQESPNELQTHCEKKIPDSLSTPLIIPVIKSTKKSFNDPNNYRGISIIPIMTKLIELAIIERCPILKDHNRSQFCFAEHSSTIHAEFLLNETINLYNSIQSPVYICSLDAEKAFDSSTWLKLFEKLIEKADIPKTVIKFLIKLYLNNLNTVSYQNTICYLRKTFDQRYYVTIKWNTH